VPPLVVEAGGKTAKFTREELAKSPYSVEAIGSYTTSAGTKYASTWGGVKLVGFLGQFVPVAADATVVFVASDGYEMSYRGAQILDAADGDWILAFRMDGQYLPNDPGYFRTIKVGPSKPNIDGHLSVRMVAKIVVKPGKVADYSLQMKGAHDLVDAAGRLVAVQPVQVDGPGAQVLEALPDVVVEVLLGEGDGVAGPVEIDASLGGEHDPRAVSPLFEPLPDHLLAPARLARDPVGVAVGRVDEGAAAGDEGVQQPESLRPVGLQAELRRAQADLGDLEIGSGKRKVAHVAASCGSDGGYGASRRGGSTPPDMEAAGGSRRFPRSPGSDTWTGMCNSPSKSGIPSPGG